MDIKTSLQSLSTTFHANLTAFTAKWDHRQLIRTTSGERSNPGDRDVVVDDIQSRIRKLNIKIKNFRRMVTSTSSSSGYDSSSDEDDRSNAHIFDPKCYEFRVASNQLRIEIEKQIARFQQASKRLGRNPKTEAEIRASINQLAIKPHLKNACFKQIQHFEQTLDDQVNQNDVMGFMTTFKSAMRCVREWQHNLLRSYQEFGMPVPSTFPTDIQSATFAALPPPAQPPAAVRDRGDSEDALFAEFRAKFDEVSVEFDNLIAIATEAAQGQPDNGDLAQALVSAEDEKNNFLEFYRSQANKIGVLLRRRDADAREDVEEKRKYTAQKLQDYYAKIIECYHRGGLQPPASIAHVRRARVPHTMVSRFLEFKQECDEVKTELDILLYRAKEASTREPEESDFAAMLEYAQMLETELNHFIDESAARLDEMADLRVGGMQKEVLKIKSHLMTFYSRILEAYKNAGYSVTVAKSTIATPSRLARSPIRDVIAAASVGPARMRAQPAASQSYMDLQPRTVPSRPGLSAPSAVDNTPRPAARGSPANQLQVPAGQLPLPRPSPAARSTANRLQVPGAAATAAEVPRASPRGASPSARLLAQRARTAGVGVVPRPTPTRQMSAVERQQVALRSQRAEQRSEQLREQREQRQELAEQAVVGPSPLSAQERQRIAGRQQQFAQNDEVALATNRALNGVKAIMAELNVPASRLGERPDDEEQATELLNSMRPQVTNPRSLEKYLNILLLVASYAKTKRSEALAASVNAKVLMLRTELRAGPSGRLTAPRMRAKPAPAAPSEDPNWREVYEQFCEQITEVNQQLLAIYEDLVEFEHFERCEGKIANFDEMRTETEEAILRALESHDNEKIEATVLHAIRQMHGDRFLCNEFSAENDNPELAARVKVLSDRIRAVQDKVKQRHAIAEAAVRGSERRRNVRPTESRQGMAFSAQGAARQARPAAPGTVPRQASRSQPPTVRSHSAARPAAAATPSRAAVSEATLARRRAELARSQERGLLRRALFQNEPEPVPTPPPVRRRQDQTAEQREAAARRDRQVLENIHRQQQIGAERRSRARAPAEGFGASARPIPSIQVQPPTPATAGRPRSVGQAAAPPTPRAVISQQTLARREAELAQSRERGLNRRQRTEHELQQRQPIPLRVPPATPRTPLTAEQRAAMIARSAKVQDHLRAQQLVGEERRARARAPADGFGATARSIPRINVQPPTPAVPGRSRSVGPRVDHSPAAAPRAVISRETLARREAELARSRELGLGRRQQTEQQLQQQRQVIPRPPPPVAPRAPLTADQRAAMSARRAAVMDNLRVQQQRGEERRARARAPIEGFGRPAPPTPRRSRSVGPAAEQAAAVQPPRQVISQDAIARRDAEIARSRAIGLSRRQGVEQQLQQQRQVIPRRAPPIAPRAAPSAEQRAALVARRAAVQDNLRRQQQLGEERRARARPPAEGFGANARAIVLPAIAVQPSPSGHRLPVPQQVLPTRAPTARQLAQRQRTARVGVVPRPPPARGISADEAARIAERKRRELERRQRLVEEQQKQAAMREAQVVMPRRLNEQERQRIAQQQEAISRKNTIMELTKKAVNAVRHEMSQRAVIVQQGLQRPANLAAALDLLGSLSDAPLANRNQIGLHLNHLLIAASLSQSLRSDTLALRVLDELANMQRRLRRTGVTPAAPAPAPAPPASPTPLQDNWLGYYTELFDAVRAANLGLLEHYRSANDTENLQCCQQKLQRFEALCSETQQSIDEAVRSGNAQQLGVVIFAAIRRLESESFACNDTRDQEHPAVRVNVLSLPERITEVMVEMQQQRQAAMEPAFVTPAEPEWPAEAGTPEDRQPTARRRLDMSAERTTLQPAQVPRELRRPPTVGRISLPQQILRENLGRRVFETMQQHEQEQLDQEQQQQAEQQRLQEQRKLQLAAAAAAQRRARPIPSTARRAAATPTVGQRRAATAARGMTTPANRQKASRARRSRWTPIRVLQYARAQDFPRTHQVPPFGWHGEPPVRGQDGYFRYMMNELNKEIFRSTRPDRPRISTDPISDNFVDPNSLLVAGLTWETDSLCGSILSEHLRMVIDNDEMRQRYIEAQKKLLQYDWTTIDNLLEAARSANDM